MFWMSDTTRCRPVRRYSGPKFGCYLLKEEASRTIFMITKMSTRAQCKFPLNAPRTAYGKGCRCEACVTEHREYYRRNSERHSRAVMKWREGNEQAHRATSQLWRTRNAEYLRTLAAIWARDNPGRQRAKGARYRAQLKLSDCSKQDRALMALIYELCPNGFEVDHIIPLSRGGAHNPENLQYLSEAENARKGSSAVYQPPPSAIVDWRTIVEPLLRRG
jgi:5-methylcytosine-specific restriction endonuclease McrA